MKKILVAAAAGAMMFGLTAASAATLNLSEGGYDSHTVQQSNVVTATCTNGEVEVAIVVSGEMVDHINLLQQNLQGCGGSQVQVVAYKVDGTILAESNKPRIVADGLNVSLTFAPGLKAQDIASVRVTIADEIASA